MNFKFAPTGFVTFSDYIDWHVETRLLTEGGQDVESGIADVVRAQILGEVQNKMRRQLIDGIVCGHFVKKNMMSEWELEPIPALYWATPEGAESMVAGLYFPKGLAVRENPYISDAAGVDLFVPKPKPVLPKSEPSHLPQKTGPKEKWPVIAQAYQSRWPTGHMAAGLTKAGAMAALTENLGFEVKPTTFKKATDSLKTQDEALD